MERIRESHRLLEASSSRREALEGAVRARLEQELQKSRETCLQQKGEWRGTLVRREGGGVRGTLVRREGGGVRGTLGCEGYTSEEGGRGCEGTLVRREGGV